MRSRAIRLSAEDWERFKWLGGPNWLRAAISRDIAWYETRGPQAVSGEADR